MWQSIDKTMNFKRRFCTIYIKFNFFAEKGLYILAKYDTINSSQKGMTPQTLANGFACK